MGVGLCFACVLIAMIRKGVAGPVGRSKQAEASSQRALCTILLQSSKTAQTSAGGSGCDTPSCQRLSWRYMGQLESLAALFLEWGDG